MFSLVCLAESDGSGKIEWHELLEEAEPSFRVVAVAQATRR